jgi:hypothetical protein
MAGQRMSGAGAGPEAKKMQGPKNTGDRRAEEITRRSEEEGPRASGSKRKRVTTDDDDDEEYDPRTELSEADEESKGCWNCKQRGIVCRRTR